MICHHSSKNKASGTVRNKDCKAKLDVKIKNITDSCKKKDKFLKKDPPLACIIKLSLIHTHDTDTAGSANFLRVEEEVIFFFFLSLYISIYFKL